MQATNIIGFPHPITLPGLMSFLAEDELSDGGKVTQSSRFPACQMEVILT